MAYRLVPGEGAFSLRRLQELMMPHRPSPAQLAGFLGAMHICR
jgi:hypothetical protein